MALVLSRFCSWRSWFDRHTYERDCCKLYPFRSAPRPLSC